MEKLYQVKDWSNCFEGAKSKTYDNKSLCQMPTKHGLGYRHVIRDSNGDGPAIFGAWCAMIQVLSTHSKPREGYCTDTGRIDGRPLTSRDLELLTDIPAEIFDKMLKLCASEAIGWLCVTESKDTTRIPQYPPSIPYTPTQTQTQTQTQTPTRVVNPQVEIDKADNQTWTLEDCRKAGSTIGVTPKMLEEFLAHYAAVGWIDGAGRKIVNLPAALAKWKSKQATVPRTGDKNQERGAKAKQNRLVVVSEIVRELERHADKDGRVRCLAAARDKYRDYGLDANRKTVIDEALEIVDFRREQRGKP